MEAVRNEDAARAGTLPAPVMDAAQLQAFLLDSFPKSPPDFVVEESDGSRVRLRLPARAVVGRPGGTASGPTLMALADSTAWIAVLSRIGPVALAVTTSLHIDFLRRPPLEDLVAEGVLLKLGSRLAVVDVAIRSDGVGDAVVAKAQVTYSIPPDRT
jgi:acyl-coenzyme A thioesterase PaaI-like protein